MVTFVHVVGGRCWCFVDFVLIVDFLVGCNDVYIYLFIFRRHIFLPEMSNGARCERVWLVKPKGGGLDRSGYGP